MLFYTLDKRKQYVEHSLHQSMTCPIWLPFQLIEIAGFWKLCNCSMYASWVSCIRGMARKEVERESSMIRALGQLSCWLKSDRNTVAIDHCTTAVWSDALLMDPNSVSGSVADYSWLNSISKKLSINATLAMYSFIVCVWIVHILDGFHKMVGF